jgi:hypothetical protein
MFHARPSSLALTAVGLVAAAILGVQLGQSAISEINPVHFQGPLAPEGITPPPEPAPYDPYAAQYVWSVPPPPLAADCNPNCAPAQFRQTDRFAMDAPAGRDTALPPWRDATPAAELRPWPPGDMPNGNLPVERYMHYPVNREQAEQAGAAAQRPPAPATTAPATATNPAEALRPEPATPAPASEQ